MKQGKKKFKNIKEMMTFLDSLRKRNESAIKYHDVEIKKYEDLLNKTENMVTEPIKQYRRRIK